MVGGTLVQPLVADLLCLGAPRGFFHVDPQRCGEALHRLFATVAPVSHGVSEMLVEPVGSFVSFEVVH